MKSLICIDPGSLGGIAHLSEEGIVSCIKMPITDGDIRDHLISLIAGSMSTMAYIERVGGYIAGNKAPGSRMFNFGDGYGFLRGILMSRHVPLEYVTPQEWQKQLRVGKKGDRTKTQWKNLLKGLAQDSFPEIDMVTLAQADALLLLKYAMKQNGLLSEPTTLFK